MKQKLVFAVIMGLITTGLVSFTLTTIYTGFGSRFLLSWIRSWSAAIFPALFSILFISPTVFRLIDRLFKNELLIQKEAMAE